MALSLTLFTWDERVVQLELNGDSTVETLAALVEARVMPGGVASRRVAASPPRRLSFPRLAAGSARRGARAQLPAHASPPLSPHGAAEPPTHRPQIETGVSAAGQQLLLNGRPLAPRTATLASCGVANGDMLLLAPPAGAGGAAGGRAQGASPLTAAAAFPLLLRLRCRRLHALGTR
jgi:hypothetical protein